MPEIPETVFAAAPTPPPGAQPRPDAQSAPSKIRSLHPATNAQPLIRAGLATIVLVFGGFGIWAALAPLAGAVMGPGVVKVDLNRKTVQHLEGGIVKEILVRDGDHVQAGDTLIVIVDERVDATVDVLQGQLDAEMAKSARLAAERDGLEQIEFPESLTSRADDPEVGQLVRTESAFFETQRRALQEQVKLLRRQTGEANREVEGLNIQARAEENAAALLAEEIAANEALDRQQYVPKVHILGLKQGIEAYAARRGEHLADIAAAQQKITELELRIVNLRDEYVQTAAHELTGVNAQIFDLEERLRPSRDAQRRQRIVAPITGTVVDLKVFTVGGVIAPRDPLMDLVPDNNPLVVEAQISVDSINDVRVGQVADVRLTAYKRRSTPLVSGAVTYVSADRLANRDSGDFYYLAHIRLSDESLAEAGNMELYPGMPAEVFIKTDERTAFDYLLAPVTASLRRSFREP